MKKILISSWLVINVACFCFADAGTNQITELLHRVETATLPVKSLSVAIHQTVEKTNAVFFSIASLSQTGTVQIIEEEDFAAVCSTSGVMHVVKGTDTKQIALSQTNATLNVPRVLLTFNPINALRHLATLNSTAVSDDFYQGLPCFKVSGTDKGFGFVLFISKSDSTIRRQIILKANETVFDSAFSYTNWNGFYAPLRTTTTKPANGVQIIQDFSQHK